MKIIAKAGDGNFLAEVSEAEIALLMGFRSVHDKGMEDVDMDIGLELQLGRMAATSEFLRNIDEKKLKTFETQLNATLLELNKTRETIQSIMLFDKLAQPEIK